MILKFSLGFCCLLIFCEAHPAESDDVRTSDVKEARAIEHESVHGEMVNTNVPGKGEKLEAEIEQIGKDMNPENVIVQATQENAELKINDEFDMKNNLENLTVEKPLTSTTTKTMVVKEEAMEHEEEEPDERGEVHEQSEMKINDEFDMKKNLESFKKDELETSTTTTMEPVITTQEPTVLYDSEGITHDQPMLKLGNEEMAKGKFNQLTIDTLPVSSTTEKPLAHDAGSVPGERNHHEPRKPLVAVQDGTPVTSVINMNDEEHSKEKLENLATEQLPVATTTNKPVIVTAEPVIDRDEFEHDEKEVEDSETIRHPNENVFEKFSETLGSRIAQEGSEYLEGAPYSETEEQSPTLKSPTEPTAEPEIYFKPASVPKSDKSITIQDSEDEESPSNTVRTKHFKHRGNQKTDVSIGVQDSVLVTPEPNKDEENFVFTERSKDTIRNRMEIEGAKDDDEEKKETKSEVDWSTWDLIHMLLLLSPYDEDEVTWWTVVLEAVKCSLRNCPMNHPYWHQRVVDLPRITRHRRQDSEFDPEAPLATTPKPCACKDLEGHFERMYDSITATAAP